MGENRSGKVYKQIPLKNGTPLTLRKSVSDDARDIIDFLNIVGGESDNLLFGAGDFRLTEQQERDYIEKNSMDSDTLMLLGLVENEIAAVAHIHGLGRKRIAHNSEMSIVVKKAFWRLGIGRAMMGELIAFAKSHDVFKTISLGVRADNTCAIRLYEQCGFKKVGVHQDYFLVNGQYCDEVLMDLSV